MPTKQELEILIRAGLNPTHVDVVNGEVIDYGVPIRTEADVNTIIGAQQQQASRPTIAPFDDGALAAGGRAARRAILPTAAGLGTTGGLLALSSAGGPVTFLPTVGAIGAGIGASALAQYLKNKFLPPSQEEAAQISQDLERHPVATFVGENLPSMAVLRPGVGALKTAGQGLLRGTKQLGTGALTFAEKAALANIGAGVGINAATEVVPSLINKDIPLDPRRVVGAALLGALDANPTAIGRRLGFPVPHEIPLPQTQGERRPIAGLLTEGEVGPPAPAQREVLQIPQQSSRGPFQQPAGRQPIALLPEVTPSTAAEKLANAQKAVEVETGQPLAKGLETKIYDRVFGDTPEGHELAQRFEKHDTDVPPPPEPEPLTEAEQLQRDFEEEDTGRYRYQHTSEIAQDLNKKLDELGVPKTLRDNMTYMQFVQEVARRRGVTVEEAELGNVAGVADLKARLAKFDPNNPNAGLDTPLHEVAHIFVDDLARAGTPAEQRMVQEGTQLFGDEEKLVNAVGLGGVRNHYSKAMNNWMRAFWSHVKFRFGKATDADFERMLSDRLLFEPGLEQRGTSLTGATRAETLNQGESEVKSGIPSFRSVDDLGRVHSDVMIDLDRRSADFSERYHNWLVNVKGKTSQEANAIVAETRANIQRQGESEIAQGRPTFETNTAKILRNRQVLALNPDKKGFYDGSTLLGRLRNQMPPAEREVLEAAGLEKFLSGNKRTPAEVEAWVRENGPRVDVKSYGAEGKMSEAAQELGRMQHEWYDTQLTEAQQTLVNDAWNARANGNILAEERAVNALERAGISQIDTRKYLNLKEQYRVEPKDTAPKMTGQQVGAYKYVSPKSIDRPMPDWTTSKSGKNVQRVDVVIPYDKAKWDAEVLDVPSKEASVKWTPDQLHEQHPNTLGWAAIQYETGPNGEKIAHIFEVQSRWGKEIREYKKNYGKESNTDHPLLRDYNRLILKAAIDQARKEGTTHIAISDAETAMMSEGHDIVAAQNQGARETARGEPVNANITQESGMRLNYDKILPQIARDLTGNEGVMVNLGEHKNAFDNAMMVLYGQTEQRNMAGPTRDISELRRARNALREQNPGNDYQIFEERGPRDNLIFHNPDGTPKTSATARLYDISSVSSRLEQEPFSLTGKRYQHVSPLAQGAVRPDTTITPAQQPTVVDTNRGSQKAGFFQILQPMIDSVATKSKHLADRLWMRAHLNVRLGGRYVGQYQHANTFNKAEWDNAYKYGHAIWNEYPTNIQLTPREQQIYKDFFQKQTRIVREDQNEVGLKVARDTRSGHRKFTEGSLNEDYMYSVMDKRVAEVLREGLNDPRRAEYIEQIAQWWVKQNNPRVHPDYSIEKARKEAEDLAIALTGERREDDAQKFNALRRAEGLGLPPELIEQDGFSAFQTYGHRAARDLAWFKAIESDKQARSMLNVPDQFGKKSDNIPELKKFSGQQEVLNVLRFMSHEKPHLEAAINAANRTMVATFLGPYSVARDILSSYVQTLPYMSVSQLPIFFKALANLENGWAASFKYGVNRNNILDLEFAPSSVSRTISNLNKLSSLVSSVQGRNLGEQFSRANTFSIGQLLGHSMYGRALAGAQTGKLDTEALKFLQLFGRGWEASVPDVIRRGYMTADEIDEIGAAFVERIQGTYDERGLPSFALQGLASPIFALSRWGIERSNMVYSDLVRPLMAGDPAAVRKLLLYTVGAVAGGEAIAAIGEILNNRKSYEPTLTELSKSKYADEGDVAQSVINLLQLSGTAGIMGDFARMAATMTRGEVPQGFSYPLADFAANTLTDNVRSATYAISEGQPFVDTILKMVGDMLRQTSQLYRIVYNNYNTEESARKDIARDLRIFRRQTDRPVPPFSNENRGSTLIGADERNFKRETDIQQARAQLGPILRRIIERNKGDVVALERELRGLKTMPISEIPSPDSDPRQFAQFFQFLRDTAGNEYAERTLRYYLQRRAANETKKLLIP